MKFSSREIPLIFFFNIRNPTRTMHRTKMRGKKKSIWKPAENDVNTLARISLKRRRQSRNLSNPRTSRIYISRGEEGEEERKTGEEA